MHRWPAFADVDTAKKPLGSWWEFAAFDQSDARNPETLIDVYQWRLAVVPGGLRQELNMEPGGWQLVRKHRLVYRRLADAPLKIERGDEVVAVAGWPVPPSVFGSKNGALRPWSPSWARDRLFSLRFQGMGCTGELGDGWDALAVITWLGLWHGT